MATDKPYRVWLSCTYYAKSTKRKLPKSAVAHGHSALWITFDEIADVDSYRVGSVNGDTGKSLSDSDIIDMWLGFTLHTIEKSSNKLYQTALAYAYETVVQIISNPSILSIGDTLSKLMKVAAKIPKKETEPEPNNDFCADDYDITKN